MACPPRKRFRPGGSAWQVPGGGCNTRVAVSAGRDAPIRSTLSALAFGALGKERLHHPGRLAGAVRLALVADPGRDAFAKAGLGHLTEARLVQAHRDRRLLGELGGERHRGRPDLVLGHEPVDQADGVALVRRHHPAGQRQVDGPRQAEHLAHDPRPGDARDPGVDLRLPHRHAGMADPHVAEQRHLEGRARRQAVQRDDERLRQRAQAVVELLPLAHPLLGAVGIERLGLVQILPGAEGAVAGAGHHDGADRRLPLRRLELRDELAAHRAVPRVEDLGAVEREEGDTPLGRRKHELIHPSPLRKCPLIIVGCDRSAIARRLCEGFRRESISG